MCYICAPVFVNFWFHYYFHAIFVAIFIFLFIIIIIFLMSVCATPTCSHQSVDGSSYYVVVVVNRYLRFRGKNYMIQNIQNTLPKTFFISSLQIYHSVLQVYINVKILSESNTTSRFIEYVLTFNYFFPEFYPREKLFWYTISFNWNDWRLLVSYWW
jgi:hypothetical protein